MYELDLVKVNRALVKAVKLAVATRRVIGKDNEAYSGIQDIEREVREAAGECQRVLELFEADANRPLLGGQESR